MGKDRQGGAVGTATAASFVAVVLLACGAEHEDASDHDDHVGESREELTVNAASDTMIRGGAPNQAAGAAANLVIQEGGPKRVLVRFSDTNVQSFPSGATVNLRVTIASIGDNWGPTGRMVSVHRLLQSWTEAGATWSCAVDTNTFLALGHGCANVVVLRAAPGLPRFSARPDRGS